MRSDCTRLQEIIRQTKGYPYFLQEWGYQAWNLAPTPQIGIGVVNQATDESTRRLDTNFFRVRFDRLTPREKQYLRALADMGETVQRSGEIADRLGVKVQSIAPVRNGLKCKLPPKALRRSIRIRTEKLASRVDQPAEAPTSRSRPYLLRVYPLRRAGVASARTAPACSSTVM
jgi:hypothetical protein